MSDNYMDSFFDKLEAKKGSVTDTHKFYGQDARGVLCVRAAEHDALAQRFRELEKVSDDAIGRNTFLETECDDLRAEVERLREIREIASQCATNGGYLSSQYLIELRYLLRSTK